MLKNANESDIYEADNEKMFMITNTNNMQNNLNISINKINPSFDNSSIFKFKIHNINTNSKKYIYRDLSKYLGDPNIDVKSIADNSESGINGTFIKNMVSPRKIRLEPIIQIKEINNERRNINDFFPNKNSENIYNDNSYKFKKEDFNLKSDPNIEIFNKIKKIQIYKKNMNRNSISNSKGNKDAKLFLSKNLKLKKHPEHPFNKYLMSKVDNDNSLFDNNEVLNNSRLENCDFSNKSIAYENDNKKIYTKINKKIDGNHIFNNEYYRSNKLKPIAITNETAIKNISNLVFNLMEKENVI